jgi:hypothetical protein
MEHEPQMDEGTVTSHQPTMVSTAIGLIFVGIGAQLVGLFGLFYWHDEIRTGIEREHPSWGDTRVSAEVLTHQAGAAVFVVLVVVFWLWLVDKFTEARPGVAMAATALAAVSVGGALQVTLDDAFPDAAKAGLLLGSAIAVAAGVLLWSPSSRRSASGH